MRLFNFIDESEQKIFYKLQDILNRSFNSDNKILIKGVVLQKGKNLIDPD